MQKFLTIIALATAMSTAHADSDGYFCVGPGYFAYEMSISTDTPDIHKLHILHLQNSNRWLEEVIVNLPSLQTGLMDCSDSVIRLYGRDVVQEIDWKPDDKSPDVSVRSILAGSSEAEFLRHQAPGSSISSRITGSLVRATPQVLPLLESEDGYRILLHQEVTLDPTNHCLAHTISTIERRRGEQLVSGKVLHAQLQDAECGE
jgi:hypothetical protein